MNNCAVLIPIYKLPLNEFEILNLEISSGNLVAHEVFVIAPYDLDLTELIVKHPQLKLEYFDKNYFQSVQDYSRLMLSMELYSRFKKDYSHILICQTDALILKPELNYWLAQSYDYIGAPWKNGYELNLITRTIPIAEGVNCKAFVGNGGLSLRKIDSCLNLFNEFPDIHETWIKFGHAEDLFFGLVGTLSRNFILPNIMTAARFSHETDADYLFNLIGNQLPFGVHGFDKYENRYIQEYLKNLISNQLTVS